jgi:phage tail-like protein
VYFVMARKRLGPMDVNEYYKTMGVKSESDAWDMPIYNAVEGKPIVGVGREAPVKSGNFAAPVYNYEGKPIISNRNAPVGKDGKPLYQVDVVRPGVPKPNERPSAPISFARQDRMFSFGENRKVYLNNSFSAVIPGTTTPIGSFTRISGIETEWILETYSEGGEFSGEHIFPRQTRNSRIVFEYGTGTLDPLYLWFKSTQLGAIVRLPLMVYIMNEKRLPVKMWMIFDAMPVKYSVPNFDALASEVAITRLEFIHTGVLNII